MTGRRIVNHLAGVVYIIVGVYFLLELGKPGAEQWYAIVGGVFVFVGVLRLGFAYLMLRQARRQAMAADAEGDA